MSEHIFLGCSVLLKVGVSFPFSHIIPAIQISQVLQGLSSSTRCRAFQTSMVSLSLLTSSCTETYKQTLKQTLRFRYLNLNLNPSLELNLGPGGALDSSAVLAGDYVEHTHLKLPLTQPFKHLNPSYNFVIILFLWEFHNGVTVIENLGLV